MALLHHKRHAIKNASVRFRLLRKSSKSIPVTLQFKTVQLAVDNRKVDPRKTVLNTQLLKNHRLSVTHVLNEQSIFCSRAYLSIVHEQPFIIPK